MDVNRIRKTELLAWHVLKIIWFLCHVSERKSRHASALASSIYLSSVPIPTSADTPVHIERLGNVNTDDVEDKPRIFEAKGWSPFCEGFLGQSQQNRAYILMSSFWKLGSLDRKIRTWRVIALWKAEIFSFQTSHWTSKSININLLFEEGSERTL